MTRQRLTKQRIWNALRACGGNVAKAARSFGYTAQGLAYQVKRHGLRDRLKALWKTRELDTEELRSALDASGGRLATTARALGLSLSTVETHIKRHKLAPYVSALQVRVAEKESKRRLHALGRHRGNVARAARELGIRFSTLHGWLERRGLVETVKALRPKQPAPDEERDLISSLLEKHDGQQWKVQRELDISKATLRARLDKYGLARQAAELRIAANKIGPRKHVRSDRYKRVERRERLMALLDSVGWNVQRAIPKSGISHGTFYALMRELGIERPRTLSSKQRLQRLIDALRLFRGNVSRVGRSLKIPDSVVREWCSEFDVHPRDYR